MSPFLERAGFETLYDRHESSVFNFCLRGTGSRDVAAAATKAAFLTVCRESHAPAGDGGGALVRLLATARRESAELTAVAGPDDAGHREVLALRELVGLSYKEIGRVIGADRATVAELLWGARLELRDELEGSSLLSIAPLAASCRRGLALIAMNWDGELADVDERAWLQAHLRTCGKCRLSQEAARQASASYREWLPAAPPLGMRESVLAAAEGCFASEQAERPAAVSEK